LNDVRQFVRQKMAPLTRLRRVRRSTKHDVVVERVGSRTERRCGCRGAFVRVDANRAEIATESRFHHGAYVRVEWFAVTGVGAGMSGLIR